MTKYSQTGREELEPPSSSVTRDTPGTGCYFLLLVQNMRQKTGPYFKKTERKAGWSLQKKVIRVYKILKQIEQKLAFEVGHAKPQNSQYMGLSATDFKYMLAQKSQACLVCGHVQFHRAYFACVPIAHYRVLPSEPRQVNIFTKASQQGDI